MKEETETRRVVMPGDEIAASEEVLPGPGTFDDGTVVRASRMGWAHIDSDDMAAKVQPLTSIPILCQEGDLVIGVITMLRPIMAELDVQMVVGLDRWVSGDRRGTIHVSKIADRYVDDAAQEYRLRDVVRGQVIGTKPSLQISTDFPGGGCLKAYCTRCSFPLARREDHLECPNCERRETRNMAPDYGLGEFDVSSEAKPIQRRAPARTGGRSGPPRGGRPGRGGGGGGGGPRGGGGRGGPPRGGRPGRGGGGGRGGPRGGGGGRGGPPRGGRRPRRD